MKNVKYGNRTRIFGITPQCSTMIAAVTSRGYCSCKRCILLCVLPLTKNRKLGTQKPFMYNKIIVNVFLNLMYFYINIVVTIIFYSKTYSVIYFTVVKQKRFWQIKKLNSHYSSWIVCLATLCLNNKSKVKWIEHISIYVVLLLKILHSIICSKWSFSCYTFNKFIKFRIPRV